MDELETEFNIFEVPILSPYADIIIKSSHTYSFMRTEKSMRIICVHRKLIALNQTNHARQQSQHLDPIVS